MVELRESEISEQVDQVFLAHGCTLFRNNIGCAKFGRNWVRYGVGGKGGADHIGFMPIRITAEMVGHVIPVFIAPEIKRPKTGKYADEQIEFRNKVLAAGGMAGFVHSWQQARDMILSWKAKFSVASQIKKS